MQWKQAAVVFTRGDAHNVGLFLLFVQLSFVGFCSCFTQGACRGEVRQGTGGPRSQGRRTHGDQVEALKCVGLTQTYGTSCTVRDCAACSTRKIRAVSKLCSPAFDSVVN